MRRMCDGDLSFRTVAERIAPESLTPSHSGFVHRNISRFGLCGSTRSSLTALDKPWFGGEFIKNRRVMESNQKRGRVNKIQGPTPTTLVTPGLDPGIHVYASASKKDVDGRDIG